MARRTSTKNRWWLFVVICIAFLIGVQILGRVFFVNGTESMQQGIYVKIFFEKIKTGDIVVFNTNAFKGSLLKYVAVDYPAEICVDDGDVLVVDGHALAQQNIEKYSIGDSPTCHCQKLASDELLVLGDHPNSFDSRYFGPIKRKDVIARVKLLWEF